MMALNIAKVHIKMIVKDDCSNGHQYSSNLLKVFVLTSRYSLSQNGLESQGQWLPFLIPAKSIPECMFGANLMIVAQSYDDL